MKTKKLRGLISLLLCLCMVAGLLPATALAAEDTPVITTESLAEATVGEAYNATLTATASDAKGTLDWEAAGLPNGLALTGSGETAALLGMPTEAGTFTVTVTVTETIPAAEPEEPAEEPAAEEEGETPAEAPQPTVLTARKEYTLTVAEPINEPAANAPLTDGAEATRTTYQSVSATIYLDDGDGQWTEGEKKTTFPVDQAGLILHLSGFATLPSGGQVESISFYPTNGSSEQEAVFWYDGEGDYVCTNGTKIDKLADNGVFQILNFTPNGNMDLVPGQYKVLAYVGNGQTGDAYQELYYLSTEIFTITEAAGPGVPVITTGTLPDATVGVSYETPLTANPATTDGSLSWALASGSNLPNGLQLDANTGTISGTPTAAVSSHAFTVQVTETVEGGEALTGTKELILTVKEPAGPTINTTELPLAFIGKRYSTTLNATAGSGGTLSWSITSNNKPDWLTLDGATGALSGTVPDSAATESISLTFRVTEALGGGITRTAEKTLALTVTKKLEITNTVTSFNPTRGQTFSLTLEANLENVTWLWKSGSLPSNLNLTGNTISGTVSAYALDGDYPYTVIARSPDGQTAEKAFTFTVGSLFYFTLPDSLDSDAIGRYASLKAMLDNNQVTLWSGTLSSESGQKLTVNSAYAGETVTAVKLTTYLNRGNVTLATAGSVTLTDGQTEALNAKNDPIITLPTFTYGELDGYVSAWFADSSGWRYNSGDLAASSENFTLKANANAYQYRSNGGTGYDLYGTPTFRGTGVSGDAGSGYTYSGGSGGDITVTYPELTKQEVTFTLQIMGGATPGTEIAPNRASLSITQYVNGSNIRTTAQIKADQNKNLTATAELYIGQEANLSLLNAGGCYLKETTINQVVNEHTLTYYTSEHTRAALLITPKLANESEDLLAYAKNLTGSKLSPTITVGSESWKINSVQAAQCAGRSKSSNIWNYSKADNIAALANGSAYSISWPAYQGLLAGELEDQTWPEGQLNDAVEVNINLKGGVLLSAINFNKSFTSLQDWWYYTDKEGHGTWITSGRTTSFYTNSAKPVDYSFYCPGDNGTYGFLLLPKEAQPIGMTWEDAVAYFEGMPYLENVNVKDNNVTTGTAKIDSVKTANARYLTLPNSTLSGPAQFTSVEELLSFTGGIQLDKGVDGKLTSLRIDAAGDDHKVAFQISSVQINGKSYNYTGIQLSGNDLPEDTLKSQQFTTYYQIDFSEPISLPCTFTVYGTAMTANSDVKLSPSVKLDDVEGVSTTTSAEWQPLGTVTAQAPALSVSIPASTGLETVPAYLTIPGSGGTVDIYDGETLVVSGARKGEVEIPLEGTNPGFTTSHNLSFRWNKKPNGMTVSDTPYEVMVLHTNGLPTLVSQQLQISNNPSRGWSTCSRDQIYSYGSANPPYFQAVCEIAHYENIKGGITFLFQLLDGTTVTQTGFQTGRDGDIWTITSKEFKSNSPVIGVSVLFEVDWDKVNQILLAGRGNPPADSPTNSADYDFDQTIVLDFYDYMNLLPESPEPDATWTTEEQTAIQRSIIQFRREVESIYERRGGDAGYYIIGDGSEFYTGRYMIEQLQPSVLPEGYTGETTFTRPLTIEQLQGELGGGEGWSRITFTEPGSTGSGTGSWGGGGDNWTTGLEIYTTEFTTDSGVSGTITITRTGTGEDTQIFETGFATARGTGTGGGQPAELPTSGTIDPGVSGRDLFSFTNFEGPTDMEVFSNWCDDTNAGAGITGSLLEILGMEGAGGFGWKLLGGVGNVLGASKSINDGLKYSSDLSSLHTRTLDLLNSPCAQKLSSGVRNSLQSQIERFSDMAIEAMAWNAATTLGGTGTGLAGAVGIMSNPWTAFTAGVALLGGSLINRQQTVNVQREAQLIQDNVDFQITKYAITNNDEDCMPDKRGRMDSADRGSGGGGYGTGSGRGGSMSTYRVCIDPSGIVYEAVLSNPVEDATVTLYTDGIDYTPTYETAKDDEGQDTGIQIMVDENGNPAKPTNTISNAKLTTPVDSTIPPETVLTTGTDGRFQWMVEQGLWYVIAYKEGYESGNSGSDIAAVVTTGTGEDTIKWLPVAPEQTNVNIPLISYAAPTVTVEAREDGVYLTFSKYMDEDTLTADGAFKINGTNAVVTLLNSEKAPSNIDYGAGKSAPSYTSQIKLAAANLSGEVAVAIAETVVSYAGVPCGSREVTDTVSEGTLVVEAPKVTGASAGQVDYGDTVTLSIPDGAAVYYTTDGSEPSETNGIRYYANQPIVITKSMTLKAVAVKYGKTSGVTSAAFTVSGTGGDIPGGDDTPTTPVTPVTPGGGSTGGSEDSSYSVSVPASSSIRGGSITVSPRRADKGDTVTITVKPNDGYELDKLTVTDSKGSELTLTNKGNGRYTFEMPASSVKIQVSFRETAAQAVNPFTDVSTGAYYYDAVLWAVANGVTNGTTATTFSPNAPVTRAQMVTFLWRAHGAPRADGANPFTDVSSNAYYYDAVLWAVANGITNGTTATTFSPDAPVTRAQAVTFQWRAAGSPVVAGDSFDDVAADAYYAGAVTWAVANGITNGTTATTFSPNTPVSRAQAVTFLYRELA